MTAERLCFQWRYRSIGVPMPAVLFLSVLVFISASALLFWKPHYLVDMPVLLSMREKDGTFFGKYHFDQSPRLYAWLHAFPAVLWGIGMPMQHMKSLRRKHIVLHRWIGRLLILISILLTVTGTYFTFGGLSMSADILHLHTLKWGTDPDTAFVYLAWPSSKFWVLTNGIWLCPGAFLTYYYARKGDITNHQRWAEIITYLGYTIAVQRFMFAVTGLVGVVLTYLPPGLRACLRVPDTLQSKHEAEKAAFSFLAWSSSALVLAYVVVQHRKKQAKSFRAAKMD
jgi:hypothetical protein